MSIMTTTAAIAPHGTRRSSWFAIFSSSLSAYRQRQRDYEHLLELPDYLLTDIGVTRQQLIQTRHRRLF